LANSERPAVALPPGRPAELKLERPDVGAVGSGSGRTGGAVVDGARTVAARGVERGDAVMTLIGGRIECVLAMEVRVAAAQPKLCIGQEELLGEPLEAWAFLGIDLPAARGETPAMNLRETLRGRRSNCAVERG
jgi:hypothetical protein